jgi:hypothetical protein
LQDKLAAASKIYASLLQLAESDDPAGHNLKSMSTDGLKELLPDIRRYSFHFHEDPAFVGNHGSVEPAARKGHGTAKRSP